MFISIKVEIFLENQDHLFEISACYEKDRLIISVKYHELE